MGLFKGYKRRKLELALLEFQAKKLDVEAREKQAEARRRRSEALDYKKEIELLKLEKERTIAEADLEDLREQLTGGGDEEINLEALLMPLMMKAFLGTNDLSSLGNLATNTPTPETSSPSLPEVPNFSGVDEFMSSLPTELLSKAARLKEPELKDIIRTNFPQFNEAEQEYAIKKIKGV